MTCEWIRLPGGGDAIVCRPRPKRRRCCHVRGCTASGSYQCDFPTGKGKTCDRYLCATHRVPQGPGRDFCRDHTGPEQLCLAIP